MKCGLCRWRATWVLIELWRRLLEIKFRSGTGQKLPQSHILTSDLSTYSISKYLTMWKPHHLSMDGGLISSYIEHFKDWMGLLSYKSTFSFAPPIKEKHISLCESHINFNRSRVYIMTGTRYRFGCHNLLQTRKRSQNLHTAYGFTHQRQMWNIQNISDHCPNWKLYFCNSPERRFRWKY